MPFTPQTTLGRTGLTVGRLGIGSSYGIGMEGLELALERGHNLFYWGSRRREPFGGALAELARRDRDRLVIAVQSFTRAATLLAPSVERALRRLEIDCADLLVLGFWRAMPPERIIEAALRLRERGRFRFLAISTHNLALTGAILRRGVFDVVMLRYNAAHREAETQAFPLLDSPDRPGVIAFTATMWGRLLDPRRMAPGETPPPAPDCYRFTLGPPQVDAALCGPRDAGQLRAALDALERGPLSDEENARIRRVGDHLAGRPWTYYV